MLPPGGWPSRDRPCVRRNPKGGFVPNSRRNTAYPGGPIADYYRVPCGFKLSRYVRVPRELSSPLLAPSRGCHPHPLTLRARVYIRDLSRRRRISYPLCRMSCGLPSTMAPGRDNAALFVQGVRHLPVYGVNVFQGLAQCVRNISRGSPCLRFNLRYRGQDTHSKASLGASVYSRARLIFFVSWHKLIRGVYIYI